MRWLIVLILGVFFAPLAVEFIRLLAARFRTAPRWCDLFCDACGEPLPRGPYAVWADHPLCRDCADESGVRPS